MSLAARVRFRPCVDRRSLAFAAVLILVSPPPGAAQGAREWTVERVVTTALARHPLAESAEARVEAARAERDRLGALPNPVGTVWVENATFPGQEPVIGLNREVSAYVTVPLDPLIQRSSRLRRADEEVRTAAAALAIARRQMAVEAVRAFYSVAVAQALAEEAEEVRASLERLAAYNRVRVDEGITAEGELLRVQVELDRAATNVTSAEVELARNRAVLRAYLGDASGGLPLASLRVAVPDLAGPAASSIPVIDVVLAQAKERRPELVSRRAHVAAAAAAIDIEHRLSVRQLGATFGNKRIGGTNGHNSMVAAVSLTVPLFDRNDAGVQRATSERVAAQRDLAWAERTIAAEVQGVFEAADRWSRQLRDLQETFLARADEVQRITLGAYEEGGATLLQVLDATRTRADARLTYTRTLFAQRESLIDLALAAGIEPVDAPQIVRAWISAPAITAEPGGRP